MGAIEEGGNIARAMIAGLKESPITLGLMALNVVFLVYIFFTQHEDNQIRRELTSLYVKQQTDIATILAKCIDPSMIENLLRQRNEQ